MNAPFFIARRLQAPLTPSGKRGARATDMTPGAAAGGAVSTGTSFSATVTKVGIASMAIGLGIIIVAFGVLFGFKREIQQKIFLFGAHIQVSKFSQNNSYEEPAMPLHTPLYDQATSLNGLRHIQAVATKAGILQTPDEIAGVAIKGVGPDYDWRLFRESLVAGTVPQVTPASSKSPTAYSTQILLSKRIADQLRLKVGQSVIMYFIDNTPRPRKLQITGIYETGLQEIDNTMVVGDLRLIQRLNNWGVDSVGSYEIFVKDFARLDDTYRQVREKASPDMRPVRVTDTYRPLFDWMLLLDKNTAIFLSLILFVASFNMVAILLVMMMERTPMIGLFKALGSSNNLIRRLFLYIGLNIVVKGLILGNVLGIGLCALQYYFHLIPLDPKNYYMDTVPIAWDFPVIVLLNLGTILLVSLIMWLPTLVITRIQPVKALVFKK